MSLIKDRITHEDGSLNLYGKRLLQSCYNYEHTIALAQARLSKPWLEDWEVPYKVVTPWE